VELKSCGSTTEHLDLVYTGDTVMSGLLTAENAFIFDADVFVTECTYLDGPPSKGAEHMHIHISDIVGNATLFQNAKQLVLTHVSAKYQPWQRALGLLQECDLPADLKSRTHVTLRTLGAPTDVTSVGSGLGARGGGGSVLARMAATVPGSTFATLSGPDRSKMRRVGGAMGWGGGARGGGGGGDGEEHEPYASQTASGDRVCAFFQSERGCLKGATCNFKHV
jgi:hypothetical protein